MGKWAVVIVIIIAVLSFAWFEWVDRWSRSYGGADSESAVSIRATADGGYVVAGTADQPNNDKDICVLKLDSKGKVRWQQTYGGPSRETASAIDVAGDGYVVAGTTNSYGAGHNDIWVMALDAQGNVRWQKTFGGPWHDEAAGVAATDDGAYLVAGTTQPGGGGGIMTWVAKLRRDGSVRWQQELGTACPPCINWVEEIRATKGGGGILVGSVSGGGSPVAIRVISLRSDGSIAWGKSYSIAGTGGLGGNSIHPTADGGYIVAGIRYPASNAWSPVALKLDANGNVQWQKLYERPAQTVRPSEPVASIREANPGYLLVGSTRTFGAGESDLWVLRLDAKGDVTWQKTYGGKADDFGHGIEAFSDGGFAVAGSSASSGRGASDFWVLRSNAKGDMPFNVAASGLSTSNMTLSAKNLNVTAQAFNIARRAKYASANTSVVPKTSIPSVETHTAGSNKLVAPSGAAAAPWSLPGVTPPSGTLNVRWTDNSNDETGYILLRSTDNVTFDRINAVGENVVGTNDVGLTRGKTYYYKIEAFSEAGYSPFSNSASGVAP